MTAYNITISNSLTMFGVAPSDKWNAYNWGSFLWGEGTADLGTVAVHLISNALSLDDALSFIVTKVLSNDLAFIADMLSERLYDGSGYSYVFPEGTTDGETRVFPDWAAASAQTSSWTVVSATSATWS